jgi:hypothetical protein
MRVRERLTYSNVMATLAVFIALGGGAYALSRGEVKSKHIARDAVKPKHVDFGAKGVPMMATFTGLGTGDSSGDNYHPVGASGAGTGLLNESISPQTFIATGLRVRVYGPVATGSREFVLRYAPPPGPTTSTALRCEVDAGETDCQSNARVRVPEGVDVWFDVSHTGTTTTDYAEVGWRALLP